MKIKFLIIFGLMKFSIYVILVILFLSLFALVESKRNSKNRKNSNPKLIQRDRPRAVTNIQRPSSSSSGSISLGRPVSAGSISRPVSSVLSSGPSIIGVPRGPRFGIVSSGFFARPMIRRFAVLRRRLTECPLEFRDNMLVVQRDSYCPEVCERSYCVQINEVCCIYKEIVDETPVVDEKTDD